MDQASRDVSLLTEQLSYYQAVAAEYEDHVIAEPGGDELVAALERFHPTGRILELACGPGAWTARLVQHATSLTAVDGSSAMLARARARVTDDRVRFVRADLFDWTPDSRYDIVFFGFWLSHVPLERFDSFWAVVARCLQPDGQVFFVDDAHRTDDELIEGPASSTIQRRLNDGSSYRIVKVPHRPAHLEDRLRSLGWRVDVHPTSGPFYWGAGTANR